MNHDDYIEAREDIAVEKDREPTEGEVLSRIVRKMERQIDKVRMRKETSWRRTDW